MSEFCIAFLITLVVLLATIFLLAFVFDSGDTDFQNDYYHDFNNSDLRSLNEKITRLELRNSFKDDSWLKR